MAAVTDPRGTRAPTSSLLAWGLAILAGCACAALVALAQGWTNAHQLGHGAPLASVVLSILVVSAVLSLYSLTRRSVHPQRSAAFALALLMPALWTSVRLLGMVCEGCAASG